MRMIFVNLPVKDLARTRAFFSALGFTFNEQFSDDKAACLVIEENIFAMLLTEPYFRTFLRGEISDAKAATEVLVALSAGSRAEVDALLAKAFDAGARPWLPVSDLGFLYSGSFQDPDGHVWEIVHMDMGEAPPSP